MPESPRPIPLRFWRSPTGREPVREWLSQLPQEDKQTMGRDMAKVQFGWPIGLPLCRSLSGGLWEVRSSLIALHAFIKKTQKTPAAELALARARMKEVVS